MEVARSNFESHSMPGIAYFAVAAGWLVPGLGHLLLRRWRRALVFFLCIGALAVVGYQMRGEAFPADSGDVFNFLGCLAELGAGAFYFLAKFLEPAGQDMARVMGDYGTRLLVTAGLLNLLCILDVWEIAKSKKA